jgi:hypothetical protein
MAERTKFISTAEVGDVVLQKCEADSTKRREM